MLDAKLMCASCGRDYSDSKSDPDIAAGARCPSDDCPSNTTGMFGWPNLEAACGGKLNPETLKRFQLAMREYEDFMDGLGAMLAPKKEDA